MTLETVIHSAPRWAEHRKNLTSDDSVPIAFADLPASAGVRPDEFRWISVRWREIEASSNLKLRPLFADDESEQWIVDVGIAERSMGLGEIEPGQFVFEPRGRTFVIALTSALFTGKVSIDVSGFGRHSH